METLNITLFVSFDSKAVDNLVQKISASPVATQDTGAAHAECPRTNTSQSQISINQDDQDSTHGQPQAPATSNLEELCDDLLETSYEDIVQVAGSVSATNVKGRLKSHIQLWVNIQAPKFILDVISEGYKLPLVQTPPRLVNKNNLSAINNSDFVVETIQELEGSGRIIERPMNTLHVINPLSVSTQSCGKKRLVLDLRYVNQFIYKKKVKFEDYRKALEYFCLGGYALKFDLKSGYHHIDIFSPHQVFQGFSWTFLDGITRYFTYTVLPFGLTSAPYIFTKVLRPLVKYWRSRRFHCIVYLDDGFILESTLKKQR